MDVRNFLREVFQAIYEADLNLAEMDEIRLVDLTLVRCQCISSSSISTKMCRWAERGWDGPSTIKTLLWIVMALYSQKNRLLYHIFRRVLPDSEVSRKYVTLVSYIQEMLETWRSESPIVQTILRSGAFDMSLFFNAIILLEDRMQAKLV